MDPLREEQVHPKRPTATDLIIILSLVGHDPLSLKLQQKLATFRERVLLPHQVYNLFRHISIRG